MAMQEVRVEVTGSMRHRICGPEYFRATAGIKAEDVTTPNGERVWKVDKPKNGKDFLIPLEGPVQEVIERRIAEVNVTGPLFCYSAITRGSPSYFNFSRHIL
jgi:hypothetical protein